MAVTRSTIEVRRSAAPAAPVHRGPELIWLLLAGAVFCAMAWLASSAEIRRSTTDAPVVNLSDLDRAEQLYPVLAVFQNAGDREYVARQILDRLADLEGGFSNAGALARIRVPRAELVANAKLDELRQRAEAAKTPTVALFTPAEFAQVKPQIAVRTVKTFQLSVWLWAERFSPPFCSRTSSGQCADSRETAPSCRC